MLKGIEAQLMITRTADLAKDASAIQRKNDLARDYLAVQAQTLAVNEKQQVAQTTKTQMLAIHKDKQGSAQQEYQEQKQKKPTQEPTQKQNQSPTTYRTTIDIRI